jgi:hypothetical protein
VYVISTVRILEPHQNLPTIRATGGAAGQLNFILLWMPNFVVFRLPCANGKLTQLQQLFNPVVLIIPNQVVIRVAAPEGDSITRHLWIAAVKLFSLTIFWYR